MYSFKELAKDLGKNTAMLDDEVGAGEYTGCLDTGCYAFNAQLSGSMYGGASNNRILGLAGETSVGKTFFAISIIDNFLKSNPRAGVIYYDTEAAINKAMLRERGIDTSRIIISEPETLQEFKTHAINFVDKYMAIDEDKRPPMMIVLDSLGQLPTIKELEDSIAGKDVRDMTRAQTIKATFRVLTLKCAKAKMPVLVTNHVYDVIGAYVPTKKMGGGSGLEYAASTIVQITKAKDRDKEKEVIGNILTVKLVKSRLSKADTVVKLRLSYSKGLDKYYGLLDLAEKYGIFKKMSKQYMMPDGTKVFESVINNNPEKYYTEDVMKQLEEAVAKEFLYGTDDVIPTISDEEETETE